MGELIEYKIDKTINHQLEKTAKRIRDVSNQKLTDAIVIAIIFLKL
jgi:hypothetical protein